MCFSCTGDCSNAAQGAAFCSPCEYFQRLCAALQRGNVPIVVGGTGLYLRWFVHGRPSTPRSDDAMAAAAQAVLDQVSAHYSVAQASSMSRSEAVIAAASGLSFMKWLSVMRDQTCDRPHSDGEHGAAKRQHCSGRSIYERAGKFLGLHTAPCPLQAWRDKATALQRQLTPEEKWAAAVDCIEVAGDPKAAARVREEFNNYYRCAGMSQPVTAKQWKVAQRVSYHRHCLGLHPNNICNS